MSKLIYLDSFRKFSLQNVRLSRILARNFCDDKSKPEDDKPAPKMNEKAKKSSEKLNSLLKAMLEDDYKKPKIDLTLAQPTNKIAKQRKKQLAELEKEQEKGDLNQNIIKATKDVAEHIGGNIGQTENELLMKLLLRRGENSASTDIPSSLSDLIVGMKIDRTKKPVQAPITTRAQYVRKTMGAQQPQERRPRRHFRDTNAKTGARVELFGGVGLGIFKDVEKLKTENLLTTSEALQQRELKLSIMHPPENYFQKMILWTEQGKLWKFPIDNEQGLEEEHNVYFAEHVFLETHLEGWCPTKGPVRHFMELVCVGLSKNPYLSVQEKKNHIEWFRDYFKGKESLLQEVGALGQIENVPKLETETKT